MLCYEEACLWYQRARRKKIEMTIGKVDGARRRKSKKENVTLTCRKLNGKWLPVTTTTIAIN